MSRTWLAAVAAAAAVLTAGCSDSTPGDLSVAAERVLAPEVQHVRDIAATGTYPQLKAAVRRLKDAVAAEQRKGQVSSSRANAIMDAADVLLTDAQPSESPSPTPTTQSPTPTPSSTPTTQSPTPTPTPSATPTSPSPSSGVTVSVSP